MGRIIRLTEKQRQVLWAAQHDASISIAALSKKSGCRPSTARAVLEFLLENEIIYPMHAIDVCRLGFSLFDIFFSLAIRKQQLREAFLEALVASEKVSLVLQLGGDYEYGFTLCVRDVGEVTEFLEQLGARFGEVFVEKAVVVRRSYTGFGRKYLTNRLVDPPVFLGQHGDQPLDEVDHRLLSVLSRERDLAYSRLARKCGIPGTTFHHRLKKLLEIGVVVRPIYAVNPHRFGMQTFRLLIYAKAVSPKFHADFYRFCRCYPPVVNLVRTVGGWDYELGVEVDELEDIPLVSQEIQARFGPALNSIRVLPLFRYLKGTNYPFVAKPA